MSEPTTEPTLLQRCAAVIRKIIGAPDYETYIAHMSLRHPEQIPMSAREFERARLTDRYNRPGSRCC